MAEAPEIRRIRALLEDGSLTPNEARAALGLPEKPRRRRWRGVVDALAIPWFLIGALLVVGLVMAQCKLAAQIAMALWFGPFFAGVIVALLLESGRDLRKAWRNDA